MLVRDAARVRRPNRTGSGRPSTDQGAPMTDATPLTAQQSISTWLAHPAGGPALREFLAGSGTDESALGPALSMPLQQLVELSGGALPQSVVDDMVRAVNGGIIPEPDEATWRERITPGRFDGRTIVVTGAASGIGRAVARRVAAEGGRVVAVDISAEKLAALSEDLGNRVVTVAADLTRAEAVQNVLAAAGERVDGLANVAGINDDFSPLHEVSDEMWARVFAVNVDALVRLSRGVLGLMLPAGRGSIVNVTSEAGLRGSASGVAYTASKHAVIGITRSAAFMYAREGIRVNAVAPGGVATGIPMQGTTSAYGEERLRPARAIMPSIADSAHLAASITFLLSDDGINVNGAILPSDGGWSAA